MMKKLVILLAFLGLVAQTSCTSKDSNSDSEVAADYDSADLEKLEGDEALEIAGADNMASDQLPEDALGETTTTTETTTMTMDETPGDSLATTEQVDVATNTETLPADPFAESVTSEPPADTSTTIVDAPMTTSPDQTNLVESSTSTESSTYTETEAPAAKPLPSLQKVADTPWKVGGTLYNTVYFARPGDTLESISQNIYGTSSRASELKKGNTMFSRRDVKPGDKVYYNSPHRPDDASRIVTYYEDNGIAPETYIAKEGDNIRTVAEGLLGYNGAWKEVWSSNTVESKQGIPAGTELRYWRAGAVAAAPVPPQQSQELAVSQPPTSALPPPPDMNHMDQMPPQDMAQGELPPPPMPEPSMDMPPPPPPMDLAQNEPPPPPPPPAPEMPASEASTDDSAGMDSDTTMALGVVGIAAAGLALLIVMRKKRKQKELEQQGLDNTHVGT